MTIKYSASARGFFDSRMHRCIPQDAVAVSPARHAALLAGQAQGCEIVPDMRGRPQLRSIRPSDLESARAACVQAIKREASRRINDRFPLWRQINALRDASDPGFHDIDAIRSASNIIEEEVMTIPTVEQLAIFPVESNPIWPEFHA
jgi:hypothetical protein